MRRRLTCLYLRLGIPRAFLSSAAAIAALLRRRFDTRASAIVTIVELDATIVDLAKRILS